MQTILVMDPDPEQRNDLIDYLGDAGYAVVTIRPHADAQRTIPSLGVALILLVLRDEGADATLLHPTTAADPLIATIPLLIWSAGPVMTTQQAYPAATCRRLPIDLARVNLLVRARIGW